MSALLATLTAEDALARLKAILPGARLETHARAFGIDTIKNKGWAGLTTERLLGLENNNRAQPDGADFELKCTKVIARAGVWVPKETVKVTQFNPAGFLSENFEESALYHKLRYWVLVGHYFPTPHEAEAVLVGGYALLQRKFGPNLEAFWNDLKELVCEGAIADHPNLGKADDYLQLRPTGDGKLMSECPLTGRRFPARAFYATKRLLGELLADATFFRFSPQDGLACPHENRTRGKKAASPGGKNLPPSR